MANSTKVMEENKNNNHFGFESALFIPAKNKFSQSQAEKFEDSNEFFNCTNKIDSSNYLESNEAQKLNCLGNLNIQSLISEDLMKKIEDCSPMKSDEAQKFKFINLKISPRVLFNKSEMVYSNNFQDENQSLNFFEDTFKGNITKKDLDKFNSYFIQNPFFSGKASDQEKQNNEIVNLINEIEHNFGKFDVLKEESIKNINEEILLSKLLESLNINNESNLEGNDVERNVEMINQQINENTGEKGIDFNSKINENAKNIIGDYGNNGQNSNTFLQNININNKFNYDIGNSNSVSQLYYYNYLMSLNPYLLNASLIFKLNYLQKIQYYLLNFKNNKCKSNNFQFGKPGWTCLYCNNFNYESKFFLIIVFCFKINILSFNFDFLSVILIR
jgi:hypothetical protein